MPTELEKKIETVIRAAPTIINEAEHSKDSSEEVNAAINAINKARLDTKATALSTKKPLTAEELRKAYLNPDNKNVIDPAWREAISKLNTDDLFKLTYMFMRYKSNKIDSEPLIRGSNLAACKVLYQTYLEKCANENPPSFKLDATPPLISEKIQILHNLNDAFASK